MTKSADPEANWSGSALFSKTGYIRVQQDKGKCVCITKDNNLHHQHADMQLVVIIIYLDFWHNHEEGIIQQKITKCT